MYLSNRSIFIRNLAAAIANGGITLVILLIAPLGLAAVIMNTLLVTASTFLVCSTMDAIAIWLLKGHQPSHLTEAQRQGELYQPPSQSSELDPYRRRDS